MTNVTTNFRKTRNLITSYGIGCNQRPSTIDHAHNKRPATHDTSAQATTPNKVICSLCEEAEFSPVSPVSYACKTYNSERNNSHIGFNDRNNFFQNGKGMKVSNEHKSTMEYTKAITSCAYQCFNSVAPFHRHPINSQHRQMQQHTFPDQHTVMQSSPAHISNDENHHSSKYNQMDRKKNQLPSTFPSSLQPDSMQQSSYQDVKYMTGMG